ncbi:MAG: ABC transporter permease subunit [Actinomycetes bacterium]
MTIELVEIDHPASETPVVPARSNAWRWWALIAVVVVWVVGWWLFQGNNTLDLPTAELTTFQKWLNDLRDSIEQAKFDGNPLFAPLTWISDTLNAVVVWLQDLFSTPVFPRPVPQVGWLGVVAIAAWTSYALAGLRIAVAVALGTFSFGLLGYWQESIDTLIITGVSVALCVLIGLPLGIWMSRSHRVSETVTPVLDVMQTMPSFAYLAPLALLFGIGNPGAVVVTLIYALPPLVRISAHGLRTVSPTTMEATTAMGSTSTQLLTKVQVPMARRTIIVGLNQTMMAALSMGVVAALINGPGLGQPVVQALESLNVGAAFVSGMCIVIMAIMLDRTAVASGERTEAASRRGVKVRSRRTALVAGAVAMVVAIYLSHVRLKLAEFPQSEIGPKLARWVNTSTTWFVDTFGQITQKISDFVTNWLLNPLQDLMANSPWWLVAGVILAIAVLLGGTGAGSWRRAVAPVALASAAVALAGLWAASSINTSWWVTWGLIVVLVVLASVFGARGALLSTSVCLAILFGVGLWNDSMVTLAMTLVAAAIVMVLGVALGVWMGRSRRADSAIRPVLDGLQTMPSFVYLVPALALFPPGRFLAIVAAVLYAAPVAIKIAADGIRGVSPTTVEAAEAAGSSRWQMIGKVQLPMSKGSMVLAANQGLLFVLSMVVIGGLVGGGGLGYLVVKGFSKPEYFGKGLAAGIAITALGVMLDRITVHTAARYGRAETA